MSSDWKSFQSASDMMNTDPAILDYKSMTIPTKIMGSQSAGNNYRNGGANYAGDYMSSSPPGCRKNSGSFGNFQAPTTQDNLRNGTSNKSFPIGTFTGMEGVGFGESNTTTNNSNSNSNSNYNDQSANQGTRETGIIEKLLVSSANFYIFKKMFLNSNE